MPEADGTRKRSRSPSDSDQQTQHKRANTGATQSADESTGVDSTTSPGSVPTAAAAAVNDVAMLDAQNIDDTAASTPTATAPVPPAGSDAGSAANEAGQDQEETSGDVKEETAATDMASSLPGGTSASGASSAAPSAMIHMRCLIVTQDASIIIGRGGKHVNEIRDKSGARVMVSESIPGNPERILNVSGPLDAVSKVKPH